MKRTFKTILFATVALIASSHAYAWMAVAIGDNSYSNVSYNNDSPEEAQADVMKGCTARSSNCRISDGNLNGTAWVIAKGNGGWGSAANRDPNTAASQAMDECRKHAKSCAIKSAAWDDGATWGAFAMSKSSMYAFINGGTQKEAEKQALANCQKNSDKDDQCKIYPDFSTSAHSFYAIADAKQSGVGIGMSGKDLATAKKYAMDDCSKETKPGDTCTVTDTAENLGPKAAPASMKRVAAIAEKNNTSVVSKTSSSNVVRCTTQCINGDCIRTFKNGRKERWQAPRVFDPFTQNWKFDIDTNACGI